MIRNNKELIVVGDRVIVKASEDGEERTNVGRCISRPRLWTIRRCRAVPSSPPDPGIPLPTPDASSDEPRRAPARETRFVPMQAREGDYALFFRKAAVEITFENDRYLVVPQQAILALVRDED